MFVLLSLIYLVCLSRSCVSWNDVTSVYGQISNPSLTLKSQIFETQIPNPKTKIWIPMPNLNNKSQSQNSESQSNPNPKLVVSTVSPLSQYRIYSVTVTVGLDFIFVGTNYAALSIPYYLFCILWRSARSQTTNHMLPSFEQQGYFSSTCKKTKHWKWSTTG